MKLLDIEKKWQKKWAESGLYRYDSSSKKPKLYALEMFSYPSGAKLHMGHWYNYSCADTWARYKRMTGYNVFHPMGFDAFGLPAENYAIKTGIHPSISTEQNIEAMESQLASIGGSWDWSYEVVTCRESYYKWTQWMFLKLYEHGLAYKKEAPVNYCPSCNTVLANEQVIGGVCERCGTVVIRKNMSQWFFKITDYAEELLSGLDSLDWPVRTKNLQRNWIGKSNGAYVTFKVADSDESFQVFTTRADTLFGATYCVLAPEHPLVLSITSAECMDAVKSYISYSATQSEIERTNTVKEKSGVFTGAYAVNPLTGQNIPIWISDYVLITYGTGAIMAVPAHDERDYDFASKFNLDIVQVLEEETGVRHDSEIKKSSIVAVVHDSSSDKYLVLDWGSNGGHLFIGGTIKNNESVLDCALREIREETGYSDVSFVRSGFKINHHYYAYNKDKYFNIEATPMLFELNSSTVSSLNLDADESFSVKWVSLSEAKSLISDELHLKSLLYLLNPGAMVNDGIHINSQFLDGLDKKDALDKMYDYLSANGIGEKTVSYKLRDWLVSRQRYWGAPIPIVYCPKCGIVPVRNLPVRLPLDVSFKPDGESPLKRCEEFVNTVCPECGSPAKREVDTLDTFVCSSWYFLRYPDALNDSEPFSKEIVDKMLPVDMYVGGVEHACMHLLYARFLTKALRDMGYLSFSEPFLSLVHQGTILGPDGEKMSKSKGNTVSPDDYVLEYGSDVLRGYLMFGFNYVDGGPWTDDGIRSIYKFYMKIERLVKSLVSSSKRYEDIDRVLNKSIKSIRTDIEKFQFNTCMSRIMEYSNALVRIENEGIPKYYLEQLLLLLAPFAPHLAEELWSVIGNSYSIHEESYPSYDEKYIEEDSRVIGVQVNGKLRAQVSVSVSDSEDIVKDKVLALDNVLKYTSGHDVVKFIYVPNRIVNVIVK